MHAFLHDLYLVLGTFVALVITNYAILARTETLASKNSINKSVLDGLFMDMGFTLTLLLIGGTHEIIGSGTLFYQAEKMIGIAFRTLTM